MKRFVPAMLLGALAMLVVWQAQARPEIRQSFFNAYPELVGTQLSDLPSQSPHCGVCHWKFTGGGPRNPFGVRVEEALALYPDDDAGRQAAIRSIENEDSDGDGFTNIVEMYDWINYSNTPTFPGLTEGNSSQTSRVDLADILPYLTPITGVDTTPPVVEVVSPNGGEVLDAGALTTVSYTASDDSGIATVSAHLSDDAGSTWRPLAKGLSPTGEWSWFVPNRPGTTNFLRIIALDGAGNSGSDDSDALFTIIGVPAGHVPTTLRDMDMPGTQPLEGAILDDPDTSCVDCHGNYDSANEPWATWRGSMMAQAARDPLFDACLAIAEQDAPSVGDLCIRCHSPGGWQEGRSTDTSGAQLTAKDRHGVQCDFCHRLVDHDYVAGVSPGEDLAVLDDISPFPLQHGNGQFINDPRSAKRGPFADVTEVGHLAIESPFHRSADLCGTCHDVSNPVFEQVASNDYVAGTFDEEHVDQDLRNMFPVERTFSEWANSEYASTGVYAPQFAGNKPDGMVSTCQDCHMPNVQAYGANVTGAPLRDDMPRHDLTGGNTFILDVLPSFYPAEVDVGQLQAAKARATAMLEKAATMELTPDDAGVNVRVTNETGHKLISGYPEGRRMWINVQGFDGDDNLVFESGAYDGLTGVLTQDGQAKVYHIEPGLSEDLAAALGLPAGPGFHFVLNDTVYLDNRIPPRGFTNAAFEAIQSPPIGYSYADGQYWDDTYYELPVGVESVTVRLYYQTLSKEYVEFLRDENETNDAGQDLYDAWAANGRSQPVLMVEASTAVTIVEPPPAPTVSSTSPVSPANDNAPKVLGSAEAGSTVRLYTDSGCTAQTAEGTAADFAAPGIAVSVGDDSTTTFWATATDASSNTSACSTTSVTYVEDSSVPAAPILTGSDPASPSSTVTTPSILGTAEAGATVTLYTAADCSGAAAGSGVATGGDFAVAVTVPANSTTTFWGTVADAAGNTSGCSATSVTYVHDDGSGGDEIFADGFESGDLSSWTPPPS